MNYSKKYILYMIDLIPIIQESSQEIEKNGSKDKFAEGQQQGYYDILKIMQDIAKDYQLPVKILGLENYKTKRNHIHTDLVINNDSKKYKEFIISIVSGIYLKLNELNIKEKNDIFSKGQRFSYYDILTVMQQQAELAFSIDLEELKLDRNFDLILT